MEPEVMTLSAEEGRIFTVREVVKGVTDESLRANTEPVDGPGWPVSRSYEVRRCLLIVLNEEWEHQFATEGPACHAETSRRQPLLEGEGIIGLCRSSLETIHLAET